MGAAAIVPDVDISIGEQRQTVSLLHILIMLKIEAVHLPMYSYRAQTEMT